jgi:hypothetical protein
MIFHYIWASVTMFWCLTFHDLQVADDGLSADCRECGRTWTNDRS